MRGDDRQQLIATYLTFSTAVDIFVETITFGHAECV